MPNGNILRRLFWLALPVVGLNVLTVLALAVDTAMCGRLPDHEVALTALGFATQVIFLLMVAMMGLTIGTVAMIARAKGSGDPARVREVLDQSTLLTLVLSVVVAVVGNLCAEPLLRLLGASDVSIVSSLDYLRPLLTFSVFTYLNLLYAAALRGVGNTVIPFAIALGSNLLNALLNYGLILGNLGMPALGVEGAAIGTSISQAVAVLALLILLARGVVPELRYRFRLVAIDWKIAWRFLVIGTPAALDMVVLNAGFLSIVGMLGRIDEVAVAAHGLGLRVQALAFVPGLSVSQATAAMVGQSLGAGDAEEARGVVRASALLSILIMSSLALLIILGADGLVNIFDVPEGTALHDLSVMWMELLGYAMPLVGLYLAYVGLIRGSGKTTISLWINVATTAIQIPLSYVFGFTMGMGPWGVWAAFPATFVLKVGLGYLYYRSSHWIRLGARV